MPAEWFNKINQHKERKIQQIHDQPLEVPWFDFSADIVFVD